MMKVRYRLTEERGADVDIVRKLEDAGKVARTGAASDASKKTRESFRGEFS
jgi:hypothetical protein